MEKHIILLNGSSSSGKSTLAKALQALIMDKRNESYEIVSIDDFLRMTTETLSEHHLRLIHVTCPLEVLQKREQERKDRCLGSAKSSYIYLFPKEGYDLTVDTHSMTASECANKIFDKIR